ncbi:polysaccharide pyruvyl transferase family protein [Parvularcula lutaonensis]|nr:polysaccharide pyruvyl transferase family protein [Parvularcula lutaonensis]GGY44539.1 hypothetical protein GCM10007148_11810 [Parvularcula lutaonensis]
MPDSHADLDWRGGDDVVSALRVAEEGAPALGHARILTATAETWSKLSPRRIIDGLRETGKATSVILEVRELTNVDSEALGKDLRNMAAELPGHTRLEFVLERIHTAFPRDEAEREALAALIDLTETLRDFATTRWALPVEPGTVYKVNGLVSAAHRIGVDVVLVPSGELLSADDRLFLDDFIRHGLLERAQPAEQGGLRAILHALREDADEEELDHTLHALRVGAGEGLSEEDSVDASFAADAAEVLMHGARAHVGRLLAPARRDPEILTRPFGKVLFIGAYGGEHIGDMAILGGVAFRVHRRHGTTQAVLMTQRPRHTRHLMPLIETPIDMEVREYTHGEIDRTLKEVDAVVWAGGPLIDIPKQLVRHLYTVSAAKRMGKPFIMEGIGPGPFTRMPSRVTAQNIVRLADHISIRTKEDAEAGILGGRDVDVGHCPAFDYLETRGRELSRLLPGELAEIERLTGDAGGCPVIGVNTRPIYHTFTVNKDGEDKAKLTREVQQRFEKEMARGIAAYHEKAVRKPIFVFFPMNAIHFGKSDLESAFNIKQHLPDDVEFRVWEADASLDGVLALMRTMDAAITMRFHATIFALSQNVEPIGVDYRIGKRYKVAAVLADAGRDHQHTRIDLLKAEWLTTQLQRLVTIRD